jgi:hypothetical protein
MTPGQVKAVLGDPVREEKQGEVTCWHYQQGQPLERNALDPNKWVLPRGALLFAPRGGGLHLAEWREP